MSESATDCPLRPALERSLDRLMDRVEDRLWGASEGAHRVEAGAGWDQVAAVGIPPEFAYFWTRFDGLELSQGEVTIASLAQIPELTKTHQERLRAGDLVIGHRGHDLYVLPKDPWAEGAVVLVVDPAKQRGPLASSVGHLVLSLLGEFALLFDDEGEYREGLYDEHSGELTPEVQRKILRRRLDMDPDGPMARFELGQLLRAQGEIRAALSELKIAVKVAPEFHWSHYELGRCYFDQDKGRPALGCFEAAAELCTDNPYLFALFSAWAIRCLEKEDPSRVEKLRAAIVAKAPTFAADQLEDATEAIEDQEHQAAIEAVLIGLAVAPKDLSLLALRSSLKKHLASLN